MRHTQPPRRAPRTIEAYNALDDEAAHVGSLLGDASYDLGRRLTEAQASTLNHVMLWGDSCDSYPITRTGRRWRVDHPILSATYPTKGEAIYAWRVQLAIARQLKKRAALDAMNGGH